MRRPWVVPAISVGVAAAVIGGGYALAQLALSNDTEATTNAGLVNPTPSIGPSLVEQPDPEPYVAPEPEPSFSIEPLPIVSAEPSPAPSPTTTSTPHTEPSVAPEPTPTAAPSLGPVAQPTPSPEVSAEPSVSPSPALVPPHPTELVGTYSYSFGAWSPTRPEYSYWRSVEGVGQLVVFLPDTSEEVVLSEGINVPWAASSVTWSPDGDRLVLIARNWHTGGDALYVYTHDGSEVVATVVAKRLHGVDWSADGTRILYAASDEKNDYYHQGRGSIVYELDLETQEVTEITPGAFPSWSPDEQAIAFLGDEGEDDTWGQWMLDLTTGETTSLSPEYPFNDFFGFHRDANTRWMASWSPDGSRLLYMAPGSEVYFTSDDGVEFRRAVIVMSTRDGSEQEIVDDWAYARPGWSPDGTKWFEGAGVYDAETGRIRFVVNVVYPWHDGEYLLVRSSAKSIALYDWSGAQVGFERMPSGWHQTRFDGWSSDGRYVSIFGTGPDSEDEIFAILPIEVPE